MAISFLVKHSRCINLMYFLLQSATKDVDTASSCIVSLKKQSQQHPEVVKRSSIFWEINNFHIEKIGKSSNFQCTDASPRSNATRLLRAFDVWISNYFNQVEKEKNLFRPADYLNSKYAAQMMFAITISKILGFSTKKRGNFSVPLALQQAKHVIFFFLPFSPRRVR